MGKETTGRWLRHVLDIFRGPHNGLLHDGLLHDGLPHGGRGGLRRLAGRLARLARPLSEDAASLQAADDLRPHRVKGRARQDVLEAMLRHQLAGDVVDARAERAIQILPTEPADR